MNGTPYLSKGSYAVTNSSTERLCEWRGLNCPAGHEPNASFEQRQLRSNEQLDRAALRMAWADWLAGHEQKTTELISHSVVYLYHYDNKLSLLQLQDSSN